MLRVPERHQKDSGRLVLGRASPIARARVTTDRRDRAAGFALPGAALMMDGVEPIKADILPVRRGLHHRRHATEPGHDRGDEEGRAGSGARGCTDSSRLSACRFRSTASPRRSTH